LDCINSDGMVEVSSSPGLGVDYDWKMNEKNTLEQVIIS